MLHESRRSPARLDDWPHDQPLRERRFGERLTLRGLSRAAAAAEGDNGLRAATGGDPARALPLRADDFDFDLEAGLRTGDLEAPRGPLAVAALPPAGLAAGLRCLAAGGELDSTVNTRVPTHTPDSTPAASRAFFAQYTAAESTLVEAAHGRGVSALWLRRP